MAMHGGALSKIWRSSTWIAPTKRIGIISELSVRGDPGTERLTPKLLARLAICGVWGHPMGVVECVRGVDSRVRDTLSAC